jgi:hypothetical protein
MICNPIVKHGPGLKNAVWYQNNPTYVKAYYEVSRERHREHNKAWKHNNHERRRAYRRGYSEANLERHREQQKVRQQAHPEYRAISKANRRAHERDTSGSFTLRRWESLKASHDHICLRRGIQGPEITLTVDHAVPVTKGGTSDIDTIQPLCLSCNKSKGTKIINYRSKGALTCTTCITPSPASPMSRYSCLNKLQCKEGTRHAHQCSTRTD